MDTKSTKTKHPKTTPPKTPSTKRQPGGQFGNDHGMRHGLRTGKLPKDAKYIEVRINILRRQIEATVIEIKGEITLADAACIQTITRWEKHACLAQRWLTKQYDELKPEQRLHFSREIARASTERDRAIANLKLDAPANNMPWLTATATPAEAEDD